MKSNYGYNNIQLYIIILYSYIIIFMYMLEYRVGCTLTTRVYVTFPVTELKRLQSNSLEIFSGLRFTLHQYSIKNRVQVVTMVTYCI